MIHDIKSGDLVKYYDFTVDNPDFSKPRPAMVIGYDPYRKKYNLMRITSKVNATEQEGYRLKGEELRVPKGMVYEKNNELVELYGVIKTNNIIQVDRERLTTKSDVFSFDFKKSVLDKYMTLQHKSWFKEYADYYSDTHYKIMSYFKDDLVAEKLGYFDDLDENVYDFFKDEFVSVKGIRQLESNKFGNRYSLLFEVDDEIFEHTFSTNKSPSEVVRDWSDERKISEWLKEDKKFHVLKRNLDVEFTPDPEVSHGYKSMGRFRKEIESKEFNIEF